MDLEHIVKKYVSENPGQSIRSLAREILENSNVEVSFSTVRRRVRDEKSNTDLETEVDSSIPMQGTTPIKDLEYSKNYVYQEDLDSYVFFLSGYNKPITLSGDKIRSLKRRYSNWDGNPDSINQICRAFQLPRSLFSKIRRALGWTHDSEPFTDEEILGRSEDGMIDELLQGKKFVIEQSYEKKKLAQTNKDADKWLKFQMGVLNPFFDYFEQDREEITSVERLNLNNSNVGEYACVISPFDFHFGKYAWDSETGNTYNREIAQDLLMKHTKDLLEDVQHYNIEKFIVPVGSDYFHIDTMHGSTTKGTPQDTDGTLTQIMFEGSYLMVKFIDMLRQIADVGIMVAPGNHDMVLSYSLLLFLQGYYRHTDDVSVTQTLTLRQYTKYGNTVIGITHGDGAKSKDLPGLMVNESGYPITKDVNRIWFTGHLHSEKVVEVQHVKLYQMPSLAGKDRWHAAKGYTSIRGMATYLICKQRGVRHNIISNVI